MQIRNSPVRPLSLTRSFPVLSCRAIKERLGYQLRHVARRSIVGARTEAPYPRIQGGTVTIQQNPVVTAIQQRRSIRKFTEESVPKDVLLSVLDAGRWAPSGLNNQPFRFLVLLAGDPRKDALADCTKYAHIVKNAPACIAVFLDRKKMYHELKDYQGAGACIQNMLLAAHALGYGAVWLGEIVNQSPQVFERLHLDPDLLRFMALLAIGRPATQGHSTRMELKQFLLEEF